MQLSKSTEHYISYFIDHFSKFYTKSPKHKQQELDNIYKKFFFKLVAAEKAVKALKYKNGSLVKIVNEEDIPYTELLNSNFIPDYIKKYINSRAIYYIVFNNKIAGKQITIYFVLFKNSDIMNIEHYESYVKLMLMWLHMSGLNTTHCLKQLKIYCYMTSYLKVLPGSILTTLSADNCNSAITYSCKENNEICIYRKEEFFKVFIHETFHALGLDFSRVNDKKLNDNLKSLFPIKSKININEAYCEFWATIINNIFVSYTLLDHKKINDFILYLDFFNNFERIFSLFQMYKILRFMGLFYSDLYNNTSTSIYLRHHMYNEETNVFAYYIIKTILFYNYEDFIILCNSMNINTFRFSGYSGNLTRIYDFVKKHYKNPKMRENMIDIKDIYNELIDDDKKENDKLQVNKKHTKKNNRKIIGTTRMTLTEL
uniref:Uncharacterized protein n=1 Tax=viral metagenome TaxID=1070528 RepID=A0A6C0KIP2_9ZZZZ